MPIEGFPDSSRHRLCIRCRKWHETHEGKTVAPSRIGGMLGAVSSTAILSAGLNPEAGRSRFLCNACRRRKTQLRIAFILLAAIVIAAVFTINR